MYKTILFDLDGTLLPVNTDEFVRHYLKALGAFAGHMVPPQQLTQQIMASTYTMIANVDPGLTNATVFAADFFPKVGYEEADLMPVFDAFYREQFPALRSTCAGVPGIARQVVETAVARGYEIVLATNPLFPRLAIEERMRWINVADLPWRLVTTYEEMCACEPQPQYFQEVLRKIGRRPEECLMVGNDLDEDGVAAKLGIGVYLVTDYLINRSGRALPPESGSLADFQAFICDLPAHSGCES